MNTEKRLLTKEAFQAVASRHGFTSCEDGTHDMLDGFMRDTQEKAITTAMFNAHSNGNVLLTANNMGPAKQLTKEYNGTLW